MGDALEILKLANFLCLPRLVAICEQYIIKETDATMENNRDMVMDNIFGMSRQFLAILFMQFFQKQTILAGHNFQEGFCRCM